MALDLTTEPLDAHTAVVALSGSLTLGTNLKIAETQLLQLIAAGTNRVILDLSHCTYADSAGLGLLVYTFGTLQQAGGSLRLCGVGDRIENLLRLTRTDRILPCDPDRAASIAALE